MKNNQDNTPAQNNNRSSELPSQRKKRSATTVDMASLVAKAEAKFEGELPGKEERKARLVAVETRIVSRTRILAELAVLFLIVKKEELYREVGCKSFALWLKKFSNVDAETARRHMLATETLQLLPPESRQGLNQGQLLEVRRAINPADPEMLPVVTETIMESRDESGKVDSLVLKDKLAGLPPVSGKPKKTNAGADPVRDVLVRFHGALQKSLSDANDSPYFTEGQQIVVMLEDLLGLSSEEGS